MSIEYLTDYLAMSARFARKHGRKVPEGERWVNHDELILALGEGFERGTHPDWIPPGRPQECYGNASELAIADNRYTYYEGYGYLPGLIPLPHAWVVDNETGQVIDNTWRDPRRSVYYGVAIDRVTLAEFLLRANRTSIFGSDWEIDYWFLREGWKRLTRLAELESVV